MNPGSQLLDIFLFQNRQYFVHAIVVLYTADQVNTNIGIDDLMDRIEAPANIRSQLWDAILNLKLADYVEQPLKNSLVRINDEGRKKYAEFSNASFEATGDFYPHVNISHMTYDETLEFIFQKHKKGNGKLFVYHGSLDPFPEHFTDARAEMKLSGVIIEDARTKGITRLDPKIKSCSTYLEAVDALQKLNSHNYVHNSVTTYGSNSPAAGRDFGTATISAGQDSEDKQMAKKGLSVSKQTLLWTVVLAVIAVITLWYMIKK